MAQIKVQIKPTGKVSFEVQGVPGQGCLNLTKGLQEQLGAVVHTEATAEAGLDTEATLTQTCSAG